MGYTVQVDIIRIKNGFTLLPKLEMYHIGNHPDFIKEILKYDTTVIDKWPFGYI